MKEALKKNSESVLLIPAIQHGVSVLWSRFLKQRNITSYCYVVIHIEERISRENVRIVGVLLPWKLQWFLICLQWEENLFDEDSVSYMGLNLDISVVKEAVKISAVTSRMYWAK